MNDVFTKDEVKIFEGMTVWLSPAYYMGEYPDALKAEQGIYIVVKVVDENGIKIHKYGEPKITCIYQANLIFAHKKNAIKDRIIKLGKIIKEREEILLGTITRERKEMDQIQKFQNELVMEL